MPDLTTITMHRCTAHVGEHQVASSRNPAKKYTVKFSNTDQRYEAWCDCPNWRFHRDDNLGNTCKHIAQLMDELCMWDEQVHGGTVAAGDVCPECGGPTETYLAAV